MQWPVLKKASNSTDVSGAMAHSMPTAIGHWGFGYARKNRSETRNYLSIYLSIYLYMHIYIYR